MTDKGIVIGFLLGIIVTIVMNFSLGVRYHLDTTYKYGKPTMGICLEDYGCSHIFRNGMLFWEWKLNPDKDVK